MQNISTTYMGIELDSPIIISSSPFTSTVENILQLQEFGAGAVVLRSIFEEQILNDASKEAAEHPESYDYVVSAKALEFTQFVSDIKEKSTLPVIASINCHSSNNWVDFAKNIELAGADALELNIMIMPEKKVIDGLIKVIDSVTIEKEIIEIAINIKNNLTIPISIKLPPYLTSTYDIANKLSIIGINALTLFNKFYTPTIDIETQTIKSKMNYTELDDVSLPLRWTSILSSNISSDISASGGVLSAESAIKLLLAGAQTVQICSLIHKEGNKAVYELNEEIRKWMREKEYNSLEDFRGKLAHSDEDQSPFDRVQFMLHLGTK